MEHRRNKILVGGDQKAARRFIGPANSQMEILKQQMSFQNLSQGVRRVWLHDDVYVECVKCFNYQECRIWVRPREEELKLCDYNKYISIKCNDYVTLLFIGGEGEIKKEPGYPRLYEDMPELKYIKSLGSSFVANKPIASEQVVYDEVDCSTGTYENITVTDSYDAGFYNEYISDCYAKRTYYKDVLGECYYQDSNQYEDIYEEGGTHERTRTEYKGREFELEYEEGGSDFILEAIEHRELDLSSFSWYHYWSCDEECGTSNSYSTDTTSYNFNNIEIASYTETIETDRDTCCDAPYDDYVRHEEGTRLKRYRPEFDTPTKERSLDVRPYSSRVDLFSVCFFVWEINQYAMHTDDRYENMEYVDYLPNSEVNCQSFLYIAPPEGGALNEPFSSYNTSSVIDDAILELITYAKDKEGWEPPETWDDVTAVHQDSRSNLWYDPDISVSAFIGIFKGENKWLIF